MKNLFIILSSCLFFYGCTTSKKVKSPPLKKKPIESSKIIPKNIPTKVKEKKISIKADLNLIFSNNIDLSKKHFLLLKKTTSIYDFKRILKKQILTQNFHPNICNVIQVIFSKNNNKVENEILNLLKNNPYLSRKNLGLSSYKIEDCLLKLSLKKRHDLQILDWMLSKNQTSKQSARNYLNKKFHKNFGQNYFSWKKFIEKGSL